MVKPVGKSIIIEIVDKNETSGIIIPEGVNLGRELEAHITAVSESCELGLKIGDIVLMKNGSASMGVPIPGDGKLIAIGENLVIAVLNYDREGR